jgi:ABC-2 type transport system ATP-binding protein
MIKVENLSKRYSGHTALDSVSFEVGRGEIVGFLGPNGAGKTTTLRILTNYLPPSSGRAEIDGLDVFKDSLEVRRRIGYMPENVPLYNDMRIKEYLRFRAALKGLKGKAMRDAVGTSMERCGLHGVRRKMIGTLSKGFRQRVGLADALINRPPLLILDEPTNGLDPNQIREVRALIKELGEDHTILISTHILPEVEMTCGRVIIINQGKIQAIGEPRSLAGQLRSAGTVRVELKGDPKFIETKLGELDAVRKVTLEKSAQDWHLYVLKVEANKDVRESIDRLARQEQWPLRELSRKGVSLEDVFAELTMHAHD